MILKLVRSSFFSEKFFFIVAGALCLWAGFPNNFISIPFLIIGWPVFIVLAALKCKNYREAFFSGWSIAFSGGCGALYWLAYPLMNVGGLPWISAEACAFLISACLAFQSGFYSQVIFFFKKSPPVFIILSAALSWYLLELIFALALGFPWLSISASFAEYPLLLQGANLFGAWFFSALWLIPFISFALWIKTGNKKLLYASAGCFLIFIGYGIYSMGKNEQLDGAEITSLFIEGNINQNQKWLPSFQEYTLNLYEDLSREGIKEMQRHKIKPSLIIWPETAMPFFYERNAQLASQLQNSVKVFNTPLLFGAPGIAREGKKEEIYNRAFLLNPEGKIIDHYDKMHLVPFGEYLPEWLNFSFLSSLLQNVGIYKSGIDPTPLIYEKLALGILICYEGIFPWLAEERVKNNANILVDISNDGWFERSSAARQHLLLTVPRAIEQKRWLFRSTNTGISAVIDASGIIKFKGQLFTRCFIPVKGRLLSEKSIYQQISCIIPFCAALFEIILFAVAFFISKNGLKNVSSK